MIGALTHGLPMVLLPMGADQPLNAARAQQLRVGEVLGAIDATPAAIRLAAATVLADPSYGRSAELIRNEIAALPGPEHALELLEQLLRERAAIRSPS